MISSAVNLFQGGALDWVFTLQFVTGLVIVILHPLGKIET